MQMITYLEEKEIREAAKVTKTSLHGYILHMEEQGKAATTISRMMAAMKAFYDAGVRTTCFISPIFPGIADIPAIVRRVKEQRNLI